MLVKPQIKVPEVACPVSDFCELADMDLMQPLCSHAESAVHMAGSENGWKKLIGIAIKKPSRPEVIPDGTGAFIQAQSIV